MSKGLFHGRQHTLIIACFHKDHPVGMKPCQI